MVAEPHFLSGRTGWSLIYSDSSPFTSHVQVITCKTKEDYEFRYISARPMYVSLLSDQ